MTVQVGLHWNYHCETLSHRRYSGSLRVVLRRVGHGLACLGVLGCEALLHFFFPMFPCLPVTLASSGDSSSTSFCAFILSSLPPKDGFSPGSCKAKVSKRKQSPSRRCAHAGGKCHAFLDIRGSVDFMLQFNRWRIVKASGGIQQQRLLEQVRR